MKACNAEDDKVGIDNCVKLTNFENDQAGNCEVAVVKRKRLAMSDW